MSALNLDRNLDKIFKSCKQMVKYRGVRQQAYTFQDGAMARVKKVTDLTKSYCKTTQVSTKKKYGLTHGKIHAPVRFGIGTTIRTH